VTNGNPPSGTGMTGRSVNQITGLIPQMLSA